MHIQLAVRIALGAHYNNTELYYTRITPGQRCYNTIIRSLQTVINIVASNITVAMAVAIMSLIMLQATYVCLTMVLLVT